MEVNCLCTAPIGINNERAFTADRGRRFYLNTAYPAPCNGTINSWRYCFYNPSNVNNNRVYRTSFAVYRVFGTGSSVRYQRVSNVTIVTWRGNEINALPRSFNCYNARINTFAIQAGDILAACVYDPAGGGTTKQLDIVGRNAAGYSLMRMEDESQCRQNSLPSSVSSSRLSNNALNSRILHLYANITGMLQYKSLLKSSSYF